MGRKIRPGEDIDPKDKSENPRTEFKGLSPDQKDFVIKELIGKYSSEIERNELFQEFNNIENDAEVVEARNQYIKNLIDKYPASAAEAIDKAYMRGEIRGRFNKVFSNKRLH